ncbi:MULTISPECIES: hypothetical protein [unclassified Enterococcus]|uniref:hypothetical protein n=1 Tax=unclassified Enterococcus TaxID=2608891 RepID=UPI001CE12E5B|nr:MULTISPECIES: hypothetical protein [unclassified Enterococcus]MCA5012007.1 hypothetical protein [Enterococcus sp. S23]MCA5015258.1 hypothetical protein [Enterococcus sp. S22(2020)]
MTKKLLLVSNLFIGFGGIAGGVMALSSNAHSILGLSEDMLRYSPFTTFLIPGLFLLVMIGCGNLAIGWANLRQTHTFPYLECLIGLVLCIWIMIQCLMLWSIVALHLIFFLLGLLQFLGGYLIIKQRQLPFPFSATQH